MGAEYTGMMGETSFDHDVTRVVAVDVENLRTRLAGALERMGYRVLNENPIQARHGARGLARSGCSQDILDYRRSLDIGLKSTGANATRVTFAYTVKGVYSGYLTKGDRNTLTREAEAILALAQSRDALSRCPACGADGIGGARFCRKCGAPVAASDPLELDLVRLTADANAGYKSVAGGLIFIVVGALIPLLIPLLTYLFKHDAMSAEKILKLAVICLSVVSGIGLGYLIAGMRRLGKMVRREPEPQGTYVESYGIAFGVGKMVGRDPEPQETPTPSRRDISAPGRVALPPQSIQHQVQKSVTEATTGLLPQEVKRTNDLN
jgi:hypothetical protein